MTEYQRGKIMTLLRLLTATAITSSFLVGGHSVAQAQDSGPVLDEIIVTAQARPKGLQDVPISVAAVDASTIEETGIVKIEDLTSLVPNFTYAETGITTAFLIRGIGSGVNQGFEQSVGVYVDGVHYPRGQQVRAPFLDLERVEVLRGPQSILFGKNSVAGAINVTTAKPTDTFEGSIFGSYEIEDGETVLEGMLSGPLSDRIRARVAGRYRDFEGFQENVTLDRDEPAREELTLRGTVEVDVTEDLMATFKAEVTEFDTIGRNIEVENAIPAPAGTPFGGLTYPQILVNVFGQDASALDFERDGRRHSNGDNSFNEMQTYQMTLDWALGDHTLQSITAYENLSYTELCDCDFTGARVFNARLEEDYSQFSQELRLTSPANDTLEYIVGAFYQTSDHEYGDQIVVDQDSIIPIAVNLQTGTPGNPADGAGPLVAGTQAARQAQVDSTILSAFAQVDWHIQEDLTLQLGARITNEDKDGSRRLDIQTNTGAALPAAQAGAPVIYANLFGITSSNLEALAGLGDPTSQFFLANLGNGVVPEQNRNITKFSPDVKLVWDVNDDALLYASWARGFKSGGFDFRANNRGQGASTADTFQFDDEIATNYELGGKFKLGGSAEINATAFFTKFDDLQISIFDGILGFNVGNAAGSEVKGIEIDGRWAVTDHIRLSGGAALTDFEFTDFVNGQCYGTQPRDGSDPRFNAETGLCDYSGLKNNLVSDFSGNLNLDFDAPIADSYEVTGLLALNYVSEYNASQTQDPNGLQDGFAKINARLGFGPQDGPWELAVLGKNLTDKIVKQYNGDTPLGGSTFGANSNYTFYGQGRTIALQGSMKF
jgi:outer membrane receptor protein involved in Fe transport